MEPNQNTSMNSVPRPKTSAKDFFLNLGAIVALYTFVGNLISLLFTIIDRAYPVINSYNYYGSYSISWPVATLIIVFPIYILLMWLLEKGYTREPEKKSVGIRKWLSYITLFLAGLALAGDLVYVLYYFIDGQELTTGFIMKALSILVVALGVFYYYISDIMVKLNGASRKVWTIVSVVIILASIVWGFSVLGSPRSQQLLKYDMQKVNDLININGLVINYYQLKGTLPKTLSDMAYSNIVDSQSGKPYQYEKTGETTYNLCAEFNKAANDKYNPSTYPYDDFIRVHPAGRYCYGRTINPSQTYPKPYPLTSPTK